MNSHAKISLFLLLLFSALAIMPCSINAQWEYQTLENLTFRYYEADRQIMKELLPLIVADISGFQRAIGFYPDIEGEIVVSPDREYYQKIISGFSGIVEFSEALYIPSERTIYIRNPRDLRDFRRLQKIVLHEYIHLFLDSVFYDVPLWFHEGMAVFFSGDLSFDRELLYARDFLLGNSLTLNEMVHQYPESRIRWESFYAKSALAVKYLYNEKREEFYNLWEYSATRTDFGEAFFRAFNLTPHQFSPLVEEHLKRRFRIEILLAFTGIIWGTLPVILLFAWLRKKWINRKIKQDWEKEILPE